MTLPWKGRTFGRQTTVHWVLLTGAPMNRTTGTAIKIVCQFVKTSIGMTVCALVSFHTSVKRLQCKQHWVELRRQLSCFFSRFESTNVILQLIMINSNDIMYSSPNLYFWFWSEWIKIPTKLMFGFSAWQHVTSIIYRSEWYARKKILKQF